MVTAIYNTFQELSLEITTPILDDFCFFFEGRTRSPRTLFYKTLLCYKLSLPKGKLLFVYSFGANLVTGDVMIFLLVSINEVSMLPYLCDLTKNCKNFKKI